MAEKNRLLLIADSDPLNDFYKVYVWLRSVEGSAFVLSALRVGRGAVILYVRHSALVLCPRCGRFRRPSASCRKGRGCELEEGGESHG